MTAIPPYSITEQIAAAAENAGVPPEAVAAAARMIAHYVEGTERCPWPEADLEDVIWAAEAVKAAAPAIRAQIFSHEHEWTPCRDQPACGAAQEPPQPCACSGVPCCELERREAEAQAEGAHAERERILAALRGRTVLMRPEEDREVSAVSWREILEVFAEGLSVPGGVLSP